MLQVKRVIASVSGKGGTGKSLTAANIAYALKMRGKEVGILDCDVRSPNITCILGIDSNVQLELNEDRRRVVKPLWNGIWVMSSAIFAANYRALTITGEQVATFLRQTVVDFDWPVPLDFLILDMDPSTGDSMKAVHEMFADKLEFVIISSSDVSSLSDCKRMVNACNEKKPPIKIVGLAANMVSSECPVCMEKIVCQKCHTEISFGDEAKVYALAAEKHIPYLGAIPFNPGIKSRTDAGNPILPNGVVMNNILERVL